MSGQKKSLMLLVYLIGLLTLWLLFRFLIGAKKNSPEEALRFQLILNRRLLQSKYANLARHWYAVAKMETAGFTSPLFLNSNNPWGMKLPKKRPTTAVPGTTITGTTGRDAGAWYDWLTGPGVVKMAAAEYRQWARYDTLEDAVDDIILWMDYTNFPTVTISLLTFTQELAKRSYFGSESVDSYYKKLEAWQAR